MFPHLTPNPKDIPSSTEEIFTARQIYISDIRITPDYIKYIRFINETNEEKYKKPYSLNKTIIDKILYEKKPDQYDNVDYVKPIRADNTYAYTSVIEMRADGVVYLFYNSEVKAIKDIEVKDT